MPPKARIPLNEDSLFADLLASENMAVVHTTLCGDLEQFITGPQTVSSTHLAHEGPIDEASEHQTSPEVQDQPFLPSPESSDSDKHAPARPRRPRRNVVLSDSDFELDDALTSASRERSQATKQTQAVGEASRGPQESGSQAWDWEKWSAVHVTELPVWCKVVYTNRRKSLPSLPEWPVVVFGPKHKTRLWQQLFTAPETSTPSPLSITGDADWRQGAVRGRTFRLLIDQLIALPTPGTLEFVRALQYYLVKMSSSSDAKDEVDYLVTTADHLCLSVRLTLFMLNFPPYTCEPPLERAPLAWRSLLLVSIAEADQPVDRATLERIGRKARTDLKTWASDNEDRKADIDLVNNGEVDKLFSFINETGGWEAGLSGADHERWKLHQLGWQTRRMMTRRDNAGLDVLRLGKLYSTRVVIPEHGDHDDWLDIALITHLSAAKNRKTEDEKTQKMMGEEKNWKRNVRKREQAKRAKKKKKAEAAEAQKPSQIIEGETVEGADPATRSGPVPNAAQPAKPSKIMARKSQADPSHDTAEETMDEHRVTTEPSALNMVKNNIAITAGASRLATEVNTVVEAHKTEQNTPEPLPHKQESGSSTTAKDGEGCSSPGRDTGISSSLSQMAEEQATDVCNHDHVLEQETEPVSATPPKADGQSVSRTEAMNRSLTVSTRDEAPQVPANEQSPEQDDACNILSEEASDIGKGKFDERLAARTVNETDGEEDTKVAAASGSTRTGAGSRNVVSTTSDGLAAVREPENSIDAFADPRLTNHGVAPRELDNVHSPSWQATGSADGEILGRPGSFGIAASEKVCTVTSEEASLESEKVAPTPQELKPIRLPPVAPALPATDALRRVFRRQRGLPSPEQAHRADQVQGNPEMGPTAASVMFSICNEVDSMFSGESDQIIDTAKIAETASSLSVSSTSSPVQVRVPDFTRSLALEYTSPRAQLAHDRPHSLPGDYRFRETSPANFPRTTDINKPLRRKMLVLTTNMAWAGHSTPIDLRLIASMVTTNADTASQSVQFFAPFFQNSYSQSIPGYSGPAPRNVSADFKHEPMVQTPAGQYFPRRSMERPAGASFTGQRLSPVSSYRVESDLNTPRWYGPLPQAIKSLNPAALVFTPNSKGLLSRTVTLPQPSENGEIAKNTRAVAEDGSRHTSGSSFEGKTMLGLRSATKCKEPSGTAHSSLSDETVEFILDGPYEPRNSGYEGMGRSSSTHRPERSSTAGQPAAEDAALAQSPSRSPPAQVAPEAETENEADAQSAGWSGRVPPSDVPLEDFLAWWRLVGISVYNANAALLQGPQA